MKSICKQCTKIFTIYSEDRIYYDKFQVPPPTLCPECRRRRRLAFRNERNLFARQSSKSGKDIIAIFRPESPYKVYSEKEWYADDWDAARYGRKYDLKRPFFEQFHELMLDVPRPNLNNDAKSERVEYSNHAGGKNCYMNFTTYKNEDCYYVTYTGEARDCVDVYDSGFSELCYETEAFMKGYNCVYMLDCENCRDSAFLLQCTGCKNCFLCSNLKHKEYWFDNKPLTRAAYEKKLKSIDLGSYQVFEEYRTKFEEMRRQTPLRHLMNDASEDVYGDRLIRCKNCFEVYGDYESENLRYCSQSGWRKDMMDVDFGGLLSQRMYESVGGLNNYQVLFTIFARDCRNVEYCDLCFNCQDCFGCVGLRHKKYHVFNRAYSSGDYERLVNKIKNQMLAQKEYGEFFPPEISPFPHEDSVAEWAYPRVPKKKINRLPDSLPDHIRDATNDLIKKPIICAVSGRPFRVIKQELEFYRKMNLPLPRLHPDVRERRRYDLVTTFQLAKTKCQKCGKQIDSRYPADTKLVVYCNECYQKSIQ